MGLLRRIGPPGCSGEQRRPSSAGILPPELLTHPCTDLGRLEQVDPRVEPHVVKRINDVFRCDVPRRSGSIWALIVGIDSLGKIRTDKL